MVLVMTQYIDIVGLTQAPIDRDAYVRALGIWGRLIPPEHRLAVLWQMHEATESHIIYTGPAGAAFWRLASRSVMVRVVPGDKEMAERIPDPMLYYLMQSGGLSRSRAQAILARKSSTPAREEAAAFAATSTDSPPELPLIGDSPPPGTMDRNPFTYREVSDPVGLIALANVLSYAKTEPGVVVGLDVEGTSEDDRTADLVGIGLSIGADTFYAPMGGPMESAVRALLDKHLPGLLYIAHNAKYDYKMMKRAGFPIDRANLVGDGMIAAYVLAEVDERGAPRPKGLKPLAARWLGVPLRTFSEMLAAAEAKDAREIPVEVLGPYCASDAYYCVEVEREVRNAIIERGIRLDLYTKLEVPNVILLAEMELAGMPVDLNAVKVMKKEYEGKVALAGVRLTAAARKAGYSKTKTATCKMHGRKKVDIVTCSACDEAGHAEYTVPFSPGSLQQLDSLLRGIWKLPRMGFTKTGQASYDEDAVLAMREWARHATREPLLGDPTDNRIEEFLTELLTWRGGAKVLSTYLVNFERMAVPQDVQPNVHIFCIHSNFNQTVVESGRLSSDDPNAQNIPLDLRGLFVAPPGYYFWVADHSQLELRILARVSGCQAMIEAFQNDQDIHALTAWRVFGISPANLKPEMRVRAKTLNFGIAYEASPDAVEKQVKRAALLYPELNLSIPTRKDCELLVREFFRAYPEVAQAVAFHHESTRQRGYSETMYGRRRYLSNITHPSQELRSRAERQAWNLVIQGTAGDIMKAGELVVAGYAPQHGADVRVQVHDELAGLVLGQMGDEWLRVVAKAMVLDQPLVPVPLKVEPKLGRTWKEAK